MKKKIKAVTECSRCEATGLYSGMGEGEGVAVICTHCNGTGAYDYEYGEFAGRKERADIKRVYISGYGFKIGLGQIEFDGVGIVDMDQEGVSYEEFSSGKEPKHIQDLVCPMTADQWACHKISGFVDMCEHLNGRWFSVIKDCKVQCRKNECWGRFHEVDQA